MKQWFTTTFLRNFCTSQSQDQNLFQNVFQICIVLVFKKYLQLISKWASKSLMSTYDDVVLMTMQIIVQIIFNGLREDK